MPRYFFNVFDGQDFFDKVGVELLGTKEVRQHMLSVAVEHIEKSENQTEIWQLEALDAEGRIVGTMDFGVDDDRHRPV